MSAGFIYEPIIVDFINKSSITVEHRFGRYVNIQTLNQNSSVILAEVDQSDKDNATITFYKESTATTISGKVIIS